MLSYEQKQIIRKAIREGKVELQLDDALQPIIVEQATGEFLFMSTDDSCVEVFWDHGGSGFFAALEQALVATNKLTTGGDA